MLLCLLVFLLLEQYLAGESEGGLGELLDLELVGGHSGVQFLAEQ